MTTYSVDTWTNSIPAGSNDLTAGSPSLHYTWQNAEKTWSLGAPSSGVIRFEVRPGDVWTAVDPTSKERSELSGSTTYAPGVQVNVSYNFMIEPGTADAASWRVMGQFHQVENNGYSPPFEIHFDGSEKMGIGVNYLGSNGAQAYKTLWTDTANIVRGHTYAMQIQATFDQGQGTGKLVVIRDGVTLVNYSGKMGFAGMSGVYWKFGIYRAAASQTIAANYSSLVVTTGGAVVSPTPPTTDVAAAYTALSSQLTTLQSDLTAAQSAVTTLASAVSTLATDLSNLHSSMVSAGYLAS